MISHLRAVLLLSCVVALAFSCRTPQQLNPAARPVALPAIAQPGTADEPPPAVREFRAAWVATVGNIDWPSKPGLPTEQQQQEIIQILDRAKEINLNAIVLQVRTTADALYDSKLEPWSYYLTGKQGQPPSPYYDPLQFWVDQAHKRGIELHAWFNPYRTKVAGSKVVPAPNHVSQAHPELNKTYGKWGWMDPGEPGSEEHSFRVFMDVVERYDVDGIHIDDYFYPYPEPVHPDDKNDKSTIPFPDDDSYRRYTDGGGKLNRADWRRANISHLIHRIYDGIKQRKKTVKFGISPFGIPRPGLPGIEYVKGFDQYDKLYADTVTWLREGWCDYFVPQLYWKTAAPQQPYLGLLEWWTKNNPKHRNIYGGLFTSRIDWSETPWCPDEILGQITITRLVPGAGGNVHFSQICLDQNRRKISDLLRDGLYAQPALVPSSSWLDNTPPPPAKDVTTSRVPAAATKPAEPASTDTADNNTNATTKPWYALTPEKPPTKPLQSVRVSWNSSNDEERVWLWSIYYRQGDDWKMQVVPGDEREIVIRDSGTNGPATRVAVAAVDRSGNESKRVTISTGLKKD